MAHRVRWGDADEDEDVLPQPHTVGPNEKGIVTKTEYFRNAKGDAIKRTTRTQLVRVKKVEYEVTSQRRNWKPFGHAAKSNEGVTMQSVEEVLFERTNLPKKDLKQEIPTADAMMTMPLADVLARRKRERELARAQGLAPEPVAPPAENDPGPGMARPKEGVYVPPTRKLGFGGAMPGGHGDRRDTDPSLRVSNLSENVTDHDLRDLFSRFGEVSRVYVAKDRDSGEHRGFAFVNFRLRTCAERAIKALNGYGFDNTILRVEMAAPKVDGGVRKMA